MKRIILVSAYACEPLKGSEQAVGWNIVLQLAKKNIVHVITRANNERSIKENIPIEYKDNIFFHYYDTPKIFLKLKNKEKGVYLYYVLWQIGILGLAIKLNRKYKFNYIFHLTFGSVWLPTFLTFLRPKFIWGPLGGGEYIPKSFIKTLSLKGRILQYFRIVLSYLFYINPFFVYTIYKSSCILCRTDDTMQIFPKNIQKKCLILTDGAIEENIFKYKKIDSADSEVKLVVTSRLIHTKNISTIIKAISLIPSKYDFSLKIVGSGPEKSNIIKLINILGISQRIELIDRVERDQVLEILSESDIYLFASLKEACNLSLLEAMAVGLPVICLNWSGMAISTNDSCAIRLPVTNPEQMPKDMAEAIVKLVENPELRRQMGENGRKRIQTVFNWEAKGQFMEELLAELDKR